ncbi:putative flippase GtrA [Arthrobacter sp. UYP6]|uniref:GtrA family protein n=1 Tax=Arthrobacter sp. UYP6 TaxID=1756378 RepID=UPI0033943C63
MFSSLSVRIRGLASLFWREVAKFGTVGAFAFVVDNGLWWLLYHGVLEGSATKARLISASVATLFSWVANRFWTFRRRRQNNVTRELVLFLIINGVGIVISSGFTWVAQYPLGITDAKWLGFAGIVGIGVATILRFFAYRFWVFNAELDEEPGYQDDYELLDEGTKEQARGKGVDSRTANGSTRVGAAGPATTAAGPAGSAVAGTGREHGRSSLEAEPTPPAAQ